jgi:protein-disulfide isomerase
MKFFKILSRSSSITRKSVLSLLLLAFLLISCSKPVQADNQPAPVAVDPKLEQQILEVIRKHPQVIMESVEKFQRDEQEKQAQAQQEAVKKITANPKALIAGSPTLGQGKTILIEFSDFQCPYCARARDSVKQFLDKRSADVTLVYKHLPLAQIHPEATPAAKAAWAAQQQGKFWPFHDALFAGQKTLSDAFYQATAKQLGLDLAKFNTDRASKAAATAIAQDLELATKLNLNGTPAFIMKGQLFTGAVPASEFEQRLNAK